MFNITQSELFNKLLGNPDMVQEILDAHDIRTNTAALGKDIAGLVYRSCHGIYYIVGNWALDYDTQQFVFLHELYHILAEAPERPYLVRLDWTRSELSSKDTTAYFGIYNKNIFNWIIRINLDSSKKQILTRLPIEKAKELALSFKVEQAPKGHGESRVFIESPDDLVQLKDLIIECFDEVMQNA